MASCKSCNAEILWGETITGRAGPFELDPTGLWLIVDGKAKRRLPDDTEGPFYTSHFATCPQAKQWRAR